MWLLTTAFMVRDCPAAGQGNVSLASRRLWGLLIGCPWVVVLLRTACLALVTSRTKIKVWSLAGAITNLSRLWSGSLALSLVSFCDLPTLAFFFCLTGSHSAARADLKLLSSCFDLPNQGNTGMTKKKKWQGFVSLNEETSYWIRVLTSDFLFIDYLKI